MNLSDYVSADLLEKFEFYNYNHALEIITQAFPEEWREIEDCLRQLSITTNDLREQGGKRCVKMVGLMVEVLGFTFVM